MSSLIQIKITRLSDQAEFDGMAWCDGSGKYEAIWNEGTLRHVFHFDGDGKQIGQNKYRMRRAE